jgi:hypothetical protein
LAAASISNQIKEKNMNSSSVASDKLSMWKKSRTPLKVVVIETGETVVWFGRLSTWHPDTSQLGLVLSETRQLKQLNLEDAELFCESDRVVVTHGDSDWLVLSEMDEPKLGSIM